MQGKHETRIGEEGRLVVAKKGKDVRAKLS
jgi:hypothetical protein